MLAAGPGTYVLWLQLAGDQRVRVGRLGDFSFPAGIYGYVGSAFGPGGLRSRLGRHFRCRKKNRWHVDYLRESADVAGAWLSYDAQGHEHEWARALTGMRGAGIAVPGFGASDCDCISHLVRFSKLPALAGFRTRVSPYTRSLEWVDAADL